MCILCVQGIAEYQRQLQRRTSKAPLEWQVQDRKARIQELNASISTIDGEVAELVEERATILNKGELPGCHGDEPAKIGYYGHGYQEYCYIW